MSSNSCTQAAKKQSTVTVDPHCIGRVIGPEGRIVKRIARDAGAGCRIRHQGNGQFLVEAWTNAAIAVAKRWVLDAAGRDTTPAPKAGRTTAKPKLVRNGAFAALAADDSDDSDEEDKTTTETTETTTKATTETKTKTKIDPTQLGFVDEGAGRFRRHQCWVNRQLWMGNEVEEGHEVHPSLAQHLQRLDGMQRRAAVANQPKGTDFSSSSDFPTLGGGVAAKSSQSSQSSQSNQMWGTDEGLARAMSEETHVKEAVVETHAMEDLQATQTEVLSLPPAPNLFKPGLLRTLSCGGAAKTLAPLTNGMAGQDDDWDYDEEGWNTTVAPGDYDETQWA